MDKPKTKTLKSLYSLLIITVFVVFAFATGETEDNSSTEQSSSYSLEYKLAVVDGHSNPSDELKRRYGRALDLLERYCPETREHIADMTVNIQKELQKENIDESLLELLQNFRTSIPEKAKQGELGKCSEIFSAYAVLRIKSNY